MIDETLGYEPQNIKITVDCIIIGYFLNEPNILLVKRKNDPFKGYWALPGGYCESFERLEDAARRELKEETNITVGKLEQVLILDDPSRDSRGRVISVVFLGYNPQGELKAGDDAERVRWYGLDCLPALGFDHELALKRADLIR